MGVLIEGVEGGLLTDPSGDIVAASVRKRERVCMGCRWTTLCLPIGPEEFFLLWDRCLECGTVMVHLGRMSSFSPYALLHVRVESSEALPKCFSNSIAGLLGARRCLSCGHDAWADRHKNRAGR